MRVSFRNTRTHREIATDLDTLPVTVTRKSGPLMGIFICLFALVWGGFPVVALFGVGGVVDKDMLWIVAIFPIVAVGLFLYGVYLLRHRKTITIDRDEIAVDEQGLFKHEIWEEPFTSYNGVLARTKQVSRSSKHSSSTYTLYLVELHHPDADKTITLFASANRDSWRGRWERAARALALPALEESADGLVERGLEDLDKSVSELLEEGTLKVDHASLQQDAEGVAVTMEGDEIVVTRTGPTNTLLGALFILAIPLIFVYFGFFFDDGEDPTAWIAGAFGLVFEAIILVSILWDLLSRERLRVGPDGMRTCTISRWGETKGRRLALAQIETIKVGGPEGGKGQPALVVVADRGKFAYGKGLARETLDFLRNLVLAKIEKSGG